MSKTALSTPSPPPIPATSRAVEDSLGELVQTIGFVFVAGPPILFLVGPLLVLVLMLIPPVALLVTLAAVLVALTAAVAVVGGVLASPYLLARHVRERRARHANVTDPAAHHVAVESL
jgi:hypothetical protein